MSPSLTVLEFICNLRWILLYAAQRLDPVIESHYASVMERAAMAETALSRSFAAVRSVREIPAVAVRVAQNGAIYILVAEAVLGRCPPTMHSFLLRATTSAVDCGESSVGSSALQSHPEPSELQTHLLFVRWLIAEGLLTDEELLDALGNSAAQRSALDRFELHLAMAKELASSEPFALGAHVILTRALLLHHCSTIVTAEDIISHVRFLNPACTGELRGMEDTLLFWVRNVIGLQQHRSGAAGMRLCCAARAALHGSLYHALQSGVVPAILLHYYQLSLLSLDEISTEGDSCVNWAAVLRAVEELGLSPGLYADEVSEAGALVLQLHVLRIAEELFTVVATQAEDAEEAIAMERTASTPLPPLPPLARPARDTSLSHNYSNGNDNDSRDDAGEERGSSVSSLPEYPSALSRRQYELMMTSLHTRNMGSGEVPMSASGPVKSWDPPLSASMESDTTYSIHPRAVFSERSTAAMAPTPAALVASHSSLSLPTKTSERLHHTEGQGSVAALRMESLGGTCTASESSFFIHSVCREDGIRPPPPLLLFPNAVRSDVPFGGGDSLDVDSAALSPLTPMDESACDPPVSLPLTHLRESFSDRDALLQALRRQQVLMQSFAQRVATAKMAEDLWRISGVSDGGSVRSSHPFLCSELDRRTDDSGQRAETDVSSVLDGFEDLMDGVESFLGTRE